MSAARKILAVFFILTSSLSCEIQRGEIAARLKCDQGYSLLINYVKQRDRGGLLPDEEEKLRASLRQADQLLTEGLTVLLKVQRETGRKLDLEKYVYASVAITGYLCDLRANGGR